VIIKIRQPGIQSTQLCGDHIGGHGAQGHHGGGHLGSSSEGKEGGDLFSDQGTSVFDLLGTGAVGLIEDEPV
jgi:hypothetical protein